MSEELKQYNVLIVDDVAHKYRIQATSKDDAFKKANELHDSGDTSKLMKKTIDRSEICNIEEVK